MSETPYTPEFIDTLNAWEQNPPLQVEYVFDLPPEDRRKADKVGVLLYQAVLIKQDHPDIDFSRLRTVTFTMDVHRTGDELERIVGHDLPQFRNAAARLDVFHLNLGPGQLLIVTDELAQAALSPQLATRLAAWELLRTELVRSVAVARLAASAAAGHAGVGTRWHSYARYGWTEYFCGFHAAVEGMQTPMARNRLRDALEQDPAALRDAARRFQADGDVAEFVGRAEGCARGLFEAMAEVLGQLDASGAKLAATDPHLDTLIRAHGLNSLWDALGANLATIGHQPADWTSADALRPVIALAQDLLAAHGLHYGPDDDVVEIRVRPDSEDETP